MAAWYNQFEAYMNTTGLTEPESIDGADVDAKGNITYTEGDKTLQIKMTKEKIYY